MTQSNGSKLALRVVNLCKEYYRSSERSRAHNLREAISNFVREPFRRVPESRFYAVKDVNLEIARGEVVGIIGRNGAGKSTLLKLLSRITEPTSGRIELYGRVGALLEVGTGFHPELTGRENIFLNGQILGMRRKEIFANLDDIISFAGVEAFIDTPVKRYSSGMYVRLAFAVAAHLKPEVLIVDEVLAVGDAEFQKKCMGKMRDVAADGRTVLLVSHNMAAIRLLCHRAILLDHGTVAGVGHPSQLCSSYMDSQALGGAQTQPDGLACSVEIVDSNGTPSITWRRNESSTVCVRIEGADLPKHVAVDIALHSEDGVKAYAIQTDRVRGRPIETHGSCLKLMLNIRNPGFLCDLLKVSVGIRASGTPQYFGLWQDIAVLRPTIDEDVYSFGTGQLMHCDARLTVEGQQQ